jgi:hypothetical protein
MRHTETSYASYWTALEAPRTKSNDLTTRATLDYIARRLLQKNALAALSRQDKASRESRFWHRFV